MLTYLHCCRPCFGQYTSAQTKRRRETKLLILILISPAGCRNDFEVVGTGPEAVSGGLQPLCEGPFLSNLETFVPHVVDLRFVTAIDRQELIFHRLLTRLGKTGWGANSRCITAPSSSFTVPEDDSENIL